MAAIGPRGVAVLAGAQEIRRNGDTNYPFRQESDFIYLTGFVEPNALIVLTPCREEGETTLFLNPLDPAAEQWNGRRLGFEAAPTELGVSSAHDIEKVDEFLPSLLDGRQTLHAHFGVDSTFDQRIFEWIAKVKSKRKDAPGEYVNLAQTLHELRLVKSQAEQAQMQKAADITAQAHIKAMKACKPGLGEWDLERELLTEFMQGGARHPAYPCIVASGENACIMHYIDNDAPLQKGQLVLIDAGCELDHYASDVTRTFPVTGKFSSVQRDLYELCLDAQAAAINTIKPGAAFTEPHEAAQKTLTQGLVDRGIIKETLVEALDNESYKKFLVHRCSHWLGLDVHDVGAYEENGKPRKFCPGMVLTVEPGIYIPSNESMDDVDSKWRGIGIRIEDDVLVTPDGHQVLSANCPKTVNEIESLMADGR